ncbi:cytochrome P450 [Nodularia sp. NIES-3585]|nr:cytochrome P450 [Nodularia sp. NIES-3585]
MPAPSTLKTPSLLQQLQWVADPVSYMEKAAQEYPDIFMANVVGFGNDLVFVNHPHAVQEILTNDRKTFFAGGKENRILRPLVGNYSTFMLDGDRHRKRRQLVMPSFHGDRMRSYGELITQITETVWSHLNCLGIIFDSKTPGSPRKTAARTGHPWGFTRPHEHFSVALSDGCL